MRRFLLSLLLTAGTIFGASAAVLPANLPGSSLPQASPDYALQNTPQYVLIELEYIPPPPPQAEGFFLLAVVDTASDPLIAYIICIPESAYTRFFHERQSPTGLAEADLKKIWRVRAGKARIVFYGDPNEFIDRIWYQFDFHLKTVFGVRPKLERFKNLKADGKVVKETSRLLNSYKGLKLAIDDQLAEYGGLVFKDDKGKLVQPFKRVKGPQWTVLERLTEDAKRGKELTKPRNSRLLPRLMNSYHGEGITSSIAGRGTTWWLSQRNI